ncbi:MAG: lytic transglycosylase domain-containing protein [Clostridiales bacterium]|nr:lytic transglycosylase domain-containing protein [Clostridiales bacterium]
MLSRRRITRLHLTPAALILFILTAPAEAGPVQERKEQYDPIIKTLARKYNVPADLVHSIIKAESNYDIWAVSPKGAAGLMQLMPETAAQYGVEDRFDPEDNIRGGVKYLKDLCKLYNSNTRLVLAAYNAGQEALKKFNGIPPYPETREYISRVMASYPKSYITGSPPVRKFVDASGQHVFTNDPYYHLNSRKNRD